MELVWHNYNYYPYEKDLAKREVKALLKPDKVKETESGLYLNGRINIEKAERLTYFYEARNKKSSKLTIQAQLESGALNGHKRQSTRYSVHGLHDYKGKFNPQIVRAILNIFEIKKGENVLDPFSGSGTTLVECAHLGIHAMGRDVNPLAVYVTNAKIKSLKTPAPKIRKYLILIKKAWDKEKTEFAKIENSDRIQYLGKWFDVKILNELEKIRLIIIRESKECSPIFLSLASNILRDYSFQDPRDLRIRRRKTPLPNTPFFETFINSTNHFLSRVESSQQLLPPRFPSCEAKLGDSKNIDQHTLLKKSNLFDCVITSPPYATALPYIDTQRLSLVWLKLLPPTEILPIEASLVGSREIRGQTKISLKNAMMENADRLPTEQHNLCLKLQSVLNGSDGFRRQAVPMLLYRYFVSMMSIFRSTLNQVKPNAPFALIVGHNHTILGGKRFDINTPLHLVSLAKFSGWKHNSTIELQTYKRFGYHQKNAVNSESLIILNGP